MLALRSLYRASKASSEVLLGFPATAAVPFSAVSVPLLAAAVASSSSALVPAASDSQAVRLSAGKSPSSCSKPPISAPATYPMAIFPGIPDTSFGVLVEPMPNGGYPHGSISEASAICSQGAEKTYAVTGILCGQARRNASDRVLSSKEMKVLQQSLELVKMDNTPIPFPHPILLSRTGVLE
ncbi:MAG: hypothetical protein FRX49_08728 [Trebouxia sp. A1-2]|nr:MAG: hypothetical protein FRX49_08728 [Trebouxia sp. A1-2]